MICGAFPRCRHMIGTHTSHSTLGQQIKSNGNDVRSVCSLPTHDWNKYTTHTNSWAAKYKQSTGEIRWPASAEKFFNYLLQQLYMGAKVLQPIPFYMNVLYCNILNRYRVCNEIPISRSQSSRQLFYEISKFDIWAALLGGKRYNNSMRFKVCSQILTVTSVVVTLHLYSYIYTSYKKADLNIYLCFSTLI